jgi:hypothetical protein
MSGAMSLWVAIIAGVFVFAIMNKYLQQLTYALLGGVLVGVLTFVAFPKGSEKDKDLLKDTANKASQGLEALKNSKNQQFKSIDELKLELSNSEKADNARMQDIDKILEE